MRIEMKMAIWQIVLAILLLVWAISLLGVAVPVVLIGAIALVAAILLLVGR